MMLDMKRTFDEVVREPGHPREGPADPGQPVLHRAVQLVRRAPRSTWRWRSSASSTATRSATATYDLIVVDTPPSRSALDFLDAPERLSSFLDGRFIRLLLAPARGPGPADDRRARAWSPTRSTKILGAQVLRDMQTFVAAFDTLFGGFRQRAAEDLRAAAGRRHGVPGGRRAGAGRAARGGVLRRAAHRGRDAAGRPGRQPGQPSRRRATLSADEAMAAAARLRAGRRRLGDGGAAPAARRPGPDRGARGAAARRGSRPRTRGVPTAVVPALADATSTTSTGCARSGTLLAGG